LDGENIKNLKVEWLRSQIGLVTQEPALLSLSIRENIAYGRSATFDQIEEAAKTAHAHGFISSLEKGYETQVKEVPYIYIYCCPTRLDCLGIGSLVLTFRNSVGWSSWYSTH
jgi:ABC-type transport system involved in Fe-S cluster assembly fused permease/ATPase subunit